MKYYIVKVNEIFVSHDWSQIGSIQLSKDDNKAFKFESFALAKACFDFLIQYVNDVTITEVFISPELTVIAWQNKLSK